jgi:hypothetical protein
MLVLNSLIQFDDIKNEKRLEVSFCVNIEIEKSRKTLTNICKITLPRKIKGYEDLDINKTFLKPGLKVSVFMGYNGELKQEFSGYISQVSFKIPLVVTCQDEMFNLKQNSLTKSWSSVDLKELIAFIYPGKASVADISLGGFVIKQQSTAQVLDSLKKYGIQSYFDSEGVLVADFAGSTKDKPRRVNYDFNKNIIDNDLEYTRKEDIRIKVKGVSKTPTGKKIEFVTGDTDGDERSLNYYNIDEESLKKIVNKEFEKLKKDGLKNTFTTFGIPYAEPGDIAVINDIIYPERNGSYLIESVTTSHGVTGFRRVITPERKLV